MAGVHGNCLCRVAFNDEPSDEVVAAVLKGNERLFTAKASIPYIPYIPSVALSAHLRQC